MPHEHDPSVDVVFYCEADGTSPVKEWLDELAASTSIRDNKLHDKCFQYFAMLETEGHTFTDGNRAKVCGNGLFDIRIGAKNVNFRILYFLHGRRLAVVAHWCTKERIIEERDMALALKRRGLFLKDPDKHTWNEELEQ